MRSEAWVGMFHNTLTWRGVSPGAGVNWGVSNVLLFQHIWGSCQCKSGERTYILYIMHNLREIRLAVGKEHTYSLTKSKPLHNQYYHDPHLMGGKGAGCGPNMWRFRCGPNMWRFRCGPNMWRFRCGPNMWSFRVRPQHVEFQGAALTCDVLGATLTCDVLGTSPTCTRSKDPPPPYSGNLPVPKALDFDEPGHTPTLYFQSDPHP